MRNTIVSQTKVLPNLINAIALWQAAAVAQGKNEKQSMCCVNFLLVLDFMCLGVIAT